MDELQSDGWILNVKVSWLQTVSISFRLRDLTNCTLSVDIRPLLNTVECDQKQALF